MRLRFAATLAFVFAMVASTAPAYDFKVPCDKTARAGKPLVRGYNCRTVTQQGYPRRYVVYVPRSRAFRLHRKAPLVLGFHGSNGSGGHFLKTSRWREQAEREGVVLAFGTALEAAIVIEGGHVETKWVTPDTSPTIDPEVKPRGYPADADWPADDTAFVATMLSDVKRQAKVDKKRIYAIGFSNGAALSAHLIRDLPGTFAALAGFGGSLHEATEVRKPVPYLLGWGQNDRHLGTADQLPVPLDPGAWTDFPNLRTNITATTDSWGATGRPSATRRSSATHLTWELDHDVVVRIVLLARLGHAYPSQGAKVSWTFFEQFAS